MKIYKMYLIDILLCAAIWFIAFGIHTDNFILIGIGGVSVGAYNTMMHKTKLKEK